MISDQQILGEIERTWRTIDHLLFAMKASSKPWIVGDFGGTIIPEQFCNFPLVLAYSTLDIVLNELVSQGVFACPRWELGAKMFASRTVLQWRDYALVERGKSARNDLCHEATTVPRTEIIEYTDAVRTELKAWAILP